MASKIGWKMYLGIVIGIILLIFILEAIDYYLYSFLGSARDYFPGHLAGIATGHESYTERDNSKYREVHHSAATIGKPMGSYYKVKEGLEPNKLDSISKLNNLESEDFLMELGVSDEVKEDHNDFVKRGRHKYGGATKYGVTSHADYPVSWQGLIPPKWTSFGRTQNPVNITGEYLDQLPQNMARRPDWQMF